MTAAPTDIVRAWFAAHAARNLEAARALLAPDAGIVMNGDKLRGFDEFMTWYQRRLANQRAFTYEIIDLLGGERHAAAVLLLRSGERGAWRQVALYECGAGVISSITAYEDAPVPLDDQVAERGNCSDGQ